MNMLIKGFIPLLAYVYIKPLLQASKSINIFGGIFKLEFTVTG